MATVALLLALGQAPAFAATIPVDGSDCTLVEAITAANSDNPVGDCTAGSGADTIVLPAGSTHTLISVADNNHGPSGLPTVTSPITIEGNNSTVRRESGAPDFRIFTALGQLTLHNTTVNGGKLPQPTAGSPFLDDGGGLLSLEATVVLTNSTVTGNSAGVGGGIAISPDFSPVVWKKAVPRGIICSRSTSYSYIRGRPYEHRV